MEPQVFGLARSASSPTASTEPVFVDPATAAMASGVSPASRSRATASATGAPEVEVVIRWQHDERVRREPELVERTRDREMGLVARVDANALEVLAARRCVQTARAPQMEVACQRHGHEVGHHATTGEEAERRRLVADEVAQPADDLLLDEGGERPGVPHIDALVRDLGKQLAHDRHRQRRRREIAELARVLRVHQAPGSRAVNSSRTSRHASGRRGGARAVARTSRVRGVVAPTRLRIRRTIAHRTDRRGAVEEFEGVVPCAGAPRRVLLWTTPRRHSRSARVPDANRIARGTRRCRAAQSAAGRWIAGSSRAMVATTLGDMAVRHRSCHARSRGACTARRGARPTRRRLRAVPLRPRAGRHGGVLRGLRLRSGRRREHDPRHRQERPAPVCRLRGARAEPPRCEPGRARSARDEEGVIRPGRVHRRDHRDGDRRRDGVRAAGRLPIWIDARVMERQRIVLGGGSRSWKVLAAPSILLALPGADVAEGLATEPRRPTSAT